MSKKMIICLYCSERFKTIKKAEKHEDKCKGISNIRKRYIERRAKEILRIYGFYIEKEKQEK